MFGQNCLSLLGWIKVLTRKPRDNSSVMTTLKWEISSVKHVYLSLPKNIKHAALLCIFKSPLNELSEQTCTSDYPYKMVLNADSCALKKRKLESFTGDEWCFFFKDFYRQSNLLYPPGKTLSFDNDACNSELWRAWQKYLVLKTFFSIFRPLQSQGTWQDFCHFIHTMVDSEE